MREFPRYVDSYLVNGTAEFMVPSAATSVLVTCSADILLSAGPGAGPIPPAAATDNPSIGAGSFHVRHASPAEERTFALPEGVVTTFSVYTAQPTEVALVWGIVW